MCDTTFVRDKKSNLFVQTNLVIYSGRFIAEKTSLTKKIKIYYCRSKNCKRKKLFLCAKRSNKKIFRTNFFYVRYSFYAR